MCASEDELDLGRVVREVDVRIETGAARERRSTFPVALNLTRGASLLPFLLLQEFQAEWWWKSKVYIAAAERAQKGRQASGEKEGGKEEQAAGLVGQQ